MLWDTEELIEIHKQVTVMLIKSYIKLLVKILQKIEEVLWSSWIWHVRFGCLTKQQASKCWRTSILRANVSTTLCIELIRLEKSKCVSSVEVAGPAFLFILHQYWVHLTALYFVTNRVNLLSRLYQGSRLTTDQDVIPIFMEMCPIISKTSARLSLIILLSLFIAVQTDFTLPLAFTCIWVL